VGATRPGLTLIFDLDPEAGLARARARNDRMEDRYERKGLEFHRRLRDGFMQIAEQEAQRCRVIDAAGSIEEVASRVNAVLRDLLHG
jgi:dTMP kinase